MDEKKLEKISMEDFEKLPSIGFKVGVKPFVKSLLLENPDFAFSTSVLANHFEVRSSCIMAIARDLEKEHFVERRGLKKGEWAIRLHPAEAKAQKKKKEAK